MEEHDRLGLVNFLDKYGYGKPTKYWVLHEGERYPSKAIVGVAHQHVDVSPLTNEDFSGGIHRVVRKLEGLGFEVEKPVRNPTWNRDELILALSLYLSNPASPPGKGSSEVADLSDLLGKLHRSTGTAESATLRNSNGVYLKMMNFRALDPAFTIDGKKGMTRGGKLEKEVWADYAQHPSLLARTAQSIRLAILAAEKNGVDDLSQADEYEGEEGGVVIRLHKRYERDSKIIREKLKEAMANGCVECEVCGFNFGEEFGDLGSGFIEVHHLKPVHKLGPKGKTSLKDLALLCSNCHRMAHRKREPLTLDEIRAARNSKADR